MRKSVPENPAVAPSRARLVELDGLRAICVLLVVFTHLVFNGYLLRPNGFFLMGGPVGVQIFFAISGFIITRMQFDERRIDGRVRLGAFYVRRFFRIIPAYWAYLLVIVVLARFGEVTLTSDALARALCFITNLRSFSLRDYWFVGHSWSLSVEEQYYLALPFLLWVVLRGRGARLAVIGVLFVLCCYGNRAGHLGVPLNLDFLLDFRFILAGVLLALGWAEAEPALARVPGWVVVIVILLLVGLEFSLSILPHLALVESPVEPFIIAGVVGWIAVHRAHLSLLRWAPVLWLGRCSYSIYLWQELFTGPREFYGPHKLATPWLGLPLLFVCAASSYYLVEKPGNAFGHRLSRRLTAR
jgi:peptidoglycan/LPS O-acetylase OafA/YrhL